MNAPKARKTRLFATLALLAVVAVACESNAPQDFLNEQGGNAAREADRLWDITFWIAVAVFVLVEGALVFTLLKFRQRPGREAAQFHGNTKLEVALTIIPSLILAGIAVPTIKTIFEAAEEPDGGMNITVVARQFWWEYQYEDLELTTANELHIPVDQPVKLTLRGVEGDVIHSFWIPRLTGAQDVVPTHDNTLIFTAEETGEYWGQCKEFCGLSHANM
ncbi:MAG: cytochrome c oxidase subunit II, partial [Actinomycetota bacterium]